MIPHREHQRHVKRRKYIRMIRAHAEVVKNTNSVAEDAKENQVKITGSASEDEAFPVSILWTGS